MSAAKRRDAPENPGGGIECPYCGCRHLPVLYTRRYPYGRIRRVRTCRHCGRRVTTYERTVDPAPEIEAPCTPTAEQS